MTVQAQTAEDQAIEVAHQEVGQVEATGLLFVKRLEALLAREERARLLGPFSANTLKY